MTEPWTELVRSACRALPLFPLPGVAFFPHTLLPLHVFEPRYIALFEDLVVGDGVLAVPQLAPGWEEDYDGQPTLRSIAGVGRMVKHDVLSDGKVNILIVGLGRVRIEQELASDGPYRVSRATLLEDRPPTVGEPHPAPSMRELRALLGQVVGSGSPVSAEFGPLLDAERGDAEIADALAHFLLRDATDRQRYLELGHLGVRAQVVVERMMTIFFGAGDSD
jgi:Lon protease-like protein